LGPDKIDGRVYMILIDETKLTNGTLMDILEDLGYNTYYYRGWTEEEKEAILKNESEENKSYVKRILDNEKHVIDFETMFEEQLPNIIFDEEELWRLVEKAVELTKQGKEDSDLVVELEGTIEKIMRY
jgi:hypothetical protein